MTDDLSSTELSGITPEVLDSPEAMRRLAANELVAAMRRKDHRGQFYWSLIARSASLAQAWKDYAEQVTSDLGKRVGEAATRATYDAVMRSTVTVYTNDEDGEPITVERTIVDILAEAGAGPRDPQSP